MFAKYLSADGCFVKTNTNNCGDIDDAICFLIPAHKTKFHLKY